MRALSSVPISERTKFDRPPGPPTDQMVEHVLTAIAKLLWPHDTAAHVAAAITKLRGGEKCAIRTVERYIEASREWSADGQAVIVAEILRRQGMRNVRVAARR